MQGMAIRPLDIAEGIRPLLASLSRRSLRADLRDHVQHVKVGICVSGGPDSMALAHLVNALPVVSGVKLNPFAIIVDHCVRQGSTKEALQVEAELQKLGITSIIVSLSWPEGSSPSKWSDFETQARKRRYRAVALTALHNRAYHVFMGHHLDDQIETGIMRLVTSKHPNLFGLRSIPRSSSLPCCDDIQGVHESHDFWGCGKDNHSYPNYSSQKTLDKDFDLRLPSNDGSAWFRPGGIMLHRPLLPFRKADLVATCVENDISFTTDVTNNDPTFTRRNAVRSLRSSEQMPKALGSQRILQLQERAEAQIERCFSSGLRYLKSFKICKLDFSVGSMMVQLPFLEDLDQEQVRGLSNAVVRLTGIVSPCERDEIPMQATTNVLKILFPYVFSNDFTDVTGLGNKNTRTAFDFLRTHFIQHPDKKNTWTLFRQPMRATEVSSNSTSLTPNISQNGMSDQSEAVHSHWTLWDNRFWIRVLCKDRRDLEDLRICPFSDVHVQQLRSTLQERNSKEAKMLLTTLEKALSLSAPGKIRFTLPALELRGRIVELPTLRLNFIDSRASTQNAIRSQVKYKSIENIDQLRLIRSGDAGKPDSTDFKTLGNILDLQPI